MNPRSLNSITQQNALPVKYSNVLRGILVSASALVFLFATACGARHVVSAHPPAGGEISAMPPAIVIGFVGGFIAHDNPVHSEVQLAARLRKEYPTGVGVETFESYRGKRARRTILHLLDTNHDGTLSSVEKENARIIIYGHSGRFGVHRSCGCA